MPTRRQFLASSLGAAAIAGRQRRHIAQDCADTAGLYERAVVIDMLATPGPFNIPWPPSGPLRPEQIESVQACGMTAVNVTVSDTDFEETVRNVALWQGEVAARPDMLMLIRNVADIDEAKATGRLGLILGFQHTELLGRDLTLLDSFHQLGVRIVQLTYNKRNFIGDGCLEKRDGGLSNFGREAVERLDTLNIVVDVSHCGPQTTLDAISESHNPVLVTHSGCLAVYDNPRNKSDEALRSMADGGGVLGLYLMPFLGNDGTPYARAEMFYRHLDHALNVCGEDHVGIGSDLSITPVIETPEYLETWRVGNELRAKQGIQAPDEAGRFPYVPEINEPRRLERIAEGMAQRGYACSVIEKVIGGNFRRALGSIW